MKLPTYSRGLGSAEALSERTMAATNGMGLRKNRPLGPGLSICWFICCWLLHALLLVARHILQMPSPTGALMW